MNIEWDCPKDIRIRTLKALLLLIPFAIWTLNSMLRSSWIEFATSFVCFLIISWIYRDV